MLRDLVTYVLAPVVVTSLVGLLVPKLVDRIKPLLQPIAVLSLACVLMGTMSKGTASILDNIGMIVFVLAPCIIPGILGLSLGHLTPRLFRMNHSQRVAASYEFGVENAAIEPALAISYFGPLAILPAVVCGKTQNLLAACIFAPYFLRKGEQLGHQQDQFNGLSDIDQSTVEHEAVLLPPYYPAATIKSSSQWVV